MSKTIDVALPAERRAMVPVTTGDASREEWLAARARGVSASEIHRIAVGSKATWRRILQDKLNGSTFKGNKHTRRGHDREPVLLGWLDAYVSPVAANGMLFAHPDHARHLATPDGLGFADGVRYGVEVKSHTYGWTRTTVPPDHYDQCQWGMWVTESEKWLYAWEVQDPDGYPSLDDPTWVWIERDKKRISELVREAERFLAWWDADAPEDDQLPDALDEALAAWADARAAKKAAEADEKAAEKLIRAHIAATPGADDNGLRLAGSRAALTFSVQTRKTLDEEAWRTTEPDSWQAWTDATQTAEQAAKDAALLYSRDTKQTRLTITPKGDQS